MLDTLCANGWAQPHDGLKILAPDALHLDYRECRDFACTTGLVASVAPKVRCAIGWSLGGTLLMEAIMRGGLQAKQLVLIAPPLQFVANDHFPHGMDPLVFRQFYQNYRDDPQRTASRFIGLIAKGDRHSRRIMSELDAWSGSADADTWHPWLDQLNGQSFNESNYSNIPHTLIIHGTNDAIVSLKQSEALAERVSHVTLRVWDEGSHAVHMHDTAGVLEAIRAHAVEHGLQ